MTFSKFNKLRMMFISSAILVAAGIAGISPTIYYHFFNNATVTNVPANVASAAPVSKPGSVTASGHPVQISIPSLNITLPVIDGYYNHQNGQWTLTLDKAQFATPSAEPNNASGNTIIYGHYRKGVFSTLHLIQPGAIAQITTSNGYVFEYKFTATYAVAPTDTSIFSYAGPPELTLQTCSGTWFQNRQMYHFDLIDYKNIRL
jgi:LPXTG-site transpeptidase (sortase) family protein